MSEGWCSCWDDQWFSGVILLLMGVVVLLVCFFFLLHLSDIESYFTYRLDVIFYLLLLVVVVVVVDETVFVFYFVVDGHLLFYSICAFLLHVTFSVTV